MLVGIEGGSPLFDKHGENSRARANRNLTPAQIRIQLEKGRGRTNANACRTGKDPSSIRSIEAGKMGAPYITIPGFYPSMPSRLIPYLAIYGARNPCAGCVEIYRRILKIESLERRRIGKGCLFFGRNCVGIYYFEFYYEL